MLKLCSDCYEKLKEVPNIVKTGNGIACWGGTVCEECEKRVTNFVTVEISNKNIEHKSRSDWENLVDDTIT